MTTEWFCDIAGDIVGPLTPTQLLGLVRAGRIKTETPLRKDDSQWVPAMEVNGLFEAAAKTPEETNAETGYLCPYCGAQVKKAPSRCGNCNRNLQRAIPMKAKEKKKVERKQTLDESTLPKPNGKPQEEGDQKKSAWSRFWSGD